MDYGVWKVVVRVVRVVDVVIVVIDGVVRVVGVVDVVIDGYAVRLRGAERLPEGDFRIGKKRMWKADGQDGGSSEREGMGSGATGKE